MVGPSVVVVTRAGAILRLPPASALATIGCDTGASTRGALVRRAVAAPRGGVFFALYPSLAFAAVAFLMVLLAENARIPIDNPPPSRAHHGARGLILEYSARHLALIEWAVAIKLFAYMTIGIALFLPWGIADAGDWSALPYAFAALAGKLALAGAGLALIEALLAKLRLFLAPEFLSTAFLLAVLGMLTHFLVKG